MAVQTGVRMEGTLSPNKPQVELFGLVQSF